MRVAVFGDIHCEADSVDAVLEYVRGDVDDIWSVGDIVDGIGDASRCCHLLEEAQVKTVRGNHERWLLTDTLRGLPDATLEVDAQARAFLASLPSTRTFELDCGGVMLCHGLGDNDMRMLTADDYGYSIEFNGELQLLLADPAIRVVVGGHTHRRMVRQFSGLTVVNAGTLRRGYRPCFAIVDFSRKTVQFFDISDDRSIVAAESHALFGGA